MVRARGQGRIAAESWRGQGPGLWRSWGLLAVVGLGSLVAWGWGCGAQAGMFCLQQSDCRPGLVCNKSPGASRSEHYGICEPARRASGEICQRSSDCVAGLQCSIELAGELAGERSDERHGICIPSTQMDGGSDDAGSDRADAAVGG